MLPPGSFSPLAFSPLLPPFSEADIVLMRRALALARHSAAAGEVPVGAVLSDAAGTILAEAGNCCIAGHDPCGHAELRAIREAAGKQGNYRLPGCRLHVTLEPCVMCAGACIQARLAEVVYGAPDPKAGALHSCYQIGADGRLNHSFAVRGGLLADECAALLLAFFRERRQVVP